MARTPRRRRTTVKPAVTQRASEWVGGRTPAPFLVREGGEDTRPHLVLWLELPSGLVVGQSVAAPAEWEGSLARALEEAFAEPLIGQPRRPAAIRVADATLAREVREVVGDAIPVRVAPTPEIDLLLRQLAEHLRGPDGPEPSYLEDGRIAPERVRRLFEAAASLWVLAPWKVADDDHVLRMDIPRLGVEGACVSIIGKLGQNRGLIIFPSLDGYDAFLAASDVPPHARREVGTPVIGLSFERREDLSSRAQREVRQHRWRVAGEDAYPWVHCHERDGSLRPTTERDVKVVAACAEALAAFFLRNPGVFADVVPEPVCESCFDRDDLEVRFTRPYEAAASFDVSPATPRGEAPTSGVGRNSPCPCGSGRKYKKCHGSRAEPANASNPLHEMDRRLVTSIVRHAERHWRKEWSEALRNYPDPQCLAELGIVWSIYTEPVAGATLAARFLEERRARLHPDERAWIEAQGRAWLSVWEVLEVERGKCLVLHDLLSGETRRVHEVSGSQTLCVREAVLGRVVDYEGVSLICGMHTRPLPPREAAEVVRRARGRLRKRRQVPIERLRDPAIGRYLVTRWLEGLADCEERASTHVALQNTDGDSLLLTTDHFRMSPGAGPRVAERLSALDGAWPDEPATGASPTSWVFLRADADGKHAEEATVIGRAELTTKTLRVESNSRPRADALRQRIEAACGDLLQHHAREHVDPLSDKLPPPSPGPVDDPPLAAPELAEFMLAHKRRHYADWVDVALPALGGQTPRQAVTTARGRSEVDVLLKEMERMESRSSPGTGYSFEGIRRELQLD
jgi:hypothetical protein